MGCAGLASTLPSPPVPSSPLTFSHLPSSPVPSSPVPSGPHLSSPLRSSPLPSPGPCSPLPSSHFPPSRLPSYPLLTPLLSVPVRVPPLMTLNVFPSPHLMPYSLALPTLVSLVSSPWSSQANQGNKLHTSESSFPINLPQSSQVNQAVPHNTSDSSSPVHSLQNLWPPVLINLLCSLIWYSFPAVSPLRGGSVTRLRHRWPGVFINSCPPPWHGQSHRCT